MSGSAAQAVVEWRTGTGTDAALMPVLELDGFAGPLDRLLALARAHRVDLARLSLPRLVDQLVAALGRAAPLERRADWLVMVSWLVQLRSDLLVPASPAQQRAAEAEAARLQGQLLALRELQALATWLRRRPQLGREVFARGRPEPLGLFTETQHQVNVIEFLWVSLALFDEDGAGADTASRYQPRLWDLHPVPEARDRILRLLGEAGEGARHPASCGSVEGFGTGNATAALLGVDQQLRGQPRTRQAGRGQTGTRGHVRHHPGQLGIQGRDPVCGIRRPDRRVLQRLHVHANCNPRLSLCNPD